MKKAGNELRKNKRWLIIAIAVIAILCMGIMLFLCIRNREIIILMDTGEMNHVEEGDYYVVSDKIDIISGDLKSPEKVECLTYEITTDIGFRVWEGNVDVNRKWTIDEAVLVNGINLLSMNAYEENGAVTKAEFVIYNECDENFSLLMEMDSDNDSLTNGFELTTCYTDPYNADSDNNGITDDKEDFDGDGLTNREEEEYGSSPLWKDTDYDGVDDYEELRLGLNPNHRDTDGDGVSDGNELLYGLNALEKDGDRIVFLQREAEIGTEVKINIDMEAEAAGAESFSLYAIPTTGIISPERIEGMVGNGISLTMEGTFQSANVEVEILENMVNSTLSYGLYYVNKEKLQFERVEKQKFYGNTIYAELEHFSDYVIIVDENIADATKSLRDNFRTDGKDTERIDTDRDGIPDKKDKTPYAAIEFASYQHYLDYFYPDKDMFNIIVNVPKVGDPTPYVNNQHGHTWMSYTRNGDTVTSGFMSADSSLLTCVGKEVTGLVKGPDNYYFTNKISKKYKYDYGMTPEPEAGMIMLPVDVTTEKYDEYLNYVNSYTKNYALIKNNCTTFVLECIRKLQIPVNLPFDELEYGDILETLMYKAGSPAQLGYSIQCNFPDTYVTYVFDEKERHYYSKMSLELAGFMEDLGYYETVLASAEDIEEKKKNGVTSENGHIYLLLDEGCTWRAAVAWAEYYGGHLVTITSEEEQGLVEQILESGTKNSYWLGGLVNTGGGFDWITGEEAAYGGRWAPGQPDDYNGNENAMMMYRNPNPRSGGSGFGMWNDLLETGYCNDEEFFGLEDFGFIVEWD